MSPLIQDELFVSAWKCSFHSPQSLCPSLSLSRPRHFDTLVDARLVPIVFENFLNHPRFLFVEYEPPVKNLPNEEPLSPNMFVWLRRLEALTCFPRIATKPNEVR